MARLWGKQVSVWVSELRAVVSWVVGTEGKQDSVVAFWGPRRHQVEVRSPTV